MSVRVEMLRDGEIVIEYRIDYLSETPTVRACGATLGDAVEQLFERLGRMRDECAEGLAKIGIRVQFESDASKGELS